jgi:hypothetical protein
MTIMPNLVYSMIIICGSNDVEITLIDNDFVGVNYARIIWEGQVIKSVLKFIGERELQMNVYLSSFFDNNSYPFLSARIPHFYFHGICDKTAHFSCLEVLEHGSLENEFMSFLECVYSVTVLMDVLYERFGFIHGDLHMDNVLYKDNKWYLIDFGKSFFSSNMYENKHDVVFFLNDLRHSIHNHRLKAMLNSLRQRKQLTWRIVGRVVRYQINKIRL